VSLSKGEKEEALRSVGRKEALWILAAYRLHPRGRGSSGRGKKKKNCASVRRLRREGEWRGSRSYRAGKRIVFSGRRGTFADKGEPVRLGRHGKDLTTRRGTYLGEGKKQRVFRWHLREEGKASRRGPGCGKLFRMDRRKRN